MFYVKGEIRPVKDRTFNYKDQNGHPATGREVAVVVELENGEHAEVKLTRDQIAGNLLAQFQASKGRVMTLPVEVYIRKGYLNVTLAPSFVFPVAAPAPAAAPAAKVG